MGWVRIDDAFNDHPKFAAAGPLGIAQWLAGLAYCNRNLTDGFIPKPVAKRLLDWDGVAWRMWQGELMGGGDDATAIDVSLHLVDVGLWHDADGGFQVHDYHDFQPTAESVKAERAKARDRMQAVRSARSSVAGSSDVRANNTVNITRSSSSPNPNPKEDQTLSATGVAGAFDDFWSLYPKKVGKQKAKAKFIVNAKRVGAAVIIDGLKAQLPTLRSADPKFIPHPTTWLERGSWDDEVDEPQRVRGWWE